MFEVLNSVQSVESLTFLDVSHKYLTDLQSDIFTALPELIRLNLSHKKLSTLDMTVMPQLDKVSSSVDLNANLWFCDCPMFNTIYYCCRNNSVDLDLVCSIPPEFKDTPWTIYEEFGYFDDDYITDIAEEVEGIVTNNDKFLTNIIYEAYEYNENFEKNENSLSTGIQEKDTTFDYKNDDVSSAVVAGFPFVYFIVFFGGFCFNS